MVGPRGDSRLILVPNEPNQLRVSLMELFRSGRERASSRSCQANDDPPGLLLLRGTRILGSSRVESGEVRWKTGAVPQL